jgi:thymidylate synthase ThyX
MTIEAKIICDSVGPNGIRLTTFLLKYPRFIHSEFMTHRMFSRNASSSRAIPFEKQVDMILADPAMPIEFRQNKKGMQAGDVLEDQEECKQLWLQSMNEVIKYAKELHSKKVHKQYVNRLLEPYSHISVVCTGTEYANFFALRHHSMAQPEIAELARLMWEAYKNNTPKQVPAGYWHLPFVSVPNLPVNEIKWESLIKSSVARCARVSYLNHEGKESTVEEDAKLYDRLLKENPKHSSPAEHQAAAHPLIYNNEVLKWSGNLKGWSQYRKQIKDENITTFEGSLG